MKSILSILFIFGALTLFGQSWCTPGATWKYTYTSGFATEGYVEIKYDGDTTIDNQLAHRLSKKFIGFDHISEQPISYNRYPEYTYENNGVVFLRYKNQWDTLYNFNATVGESWRMAKQPEVNACDSNGTITVLAASSKWINNKLLKYVVVKVNPNSYNSLYTDTIIEKIGFINGYMFPYDQCNLTLDVNEGGPFRCYSDNDFPVYKPHFSKECDYVKLETIPNKISLAIFPNPASSIIQLKADLNWQDSRFEIGTIDGKKVLSGKSTNLIDISSLEKGTYLLSVYHQAGTSTSKIVKE